MLINKHETEDDLWRYNGVDCVRTREVGEVEANIAKQLNLEAVERIQQSMFMPILKAMLRGVRIDTAARDRLANELQSEIDKRLQFFRDILGHDLNPASPTQMVKLFYEDLQQPQNKTRAKKGVPGHLTCDDEALTKIGAREPILRPLLQAIQELRSLRIFLSNFVLAGLDYDGRMRCSYNATGTETFRLSSSKNVFGSGANLQTIPKGDEEDSAGKPVLLPNVRKLFIPDPGYTMFDSDLDRADLQVVAWEADDPRMKDALRQGVDVHLLNAILVAGKEYPLEALVEGAEGYAEIRARFKLDRQKAKMLAHGTNYGGSARTMAANTGFSLHEVERWQAAYFSAYPGIKMWQLRVEKQLATERMVTNKFGYRRYYFERTDNLLPEALAWIPQSSVAIYINLIWERVEATVPDAQILLQVHDSLVGQFPTQKAVAVKAQISEVARGIVIPYDDPLIIPLGMKTSEISWGDVK